MTRRAHGLAAALALGLLGLSGSAHAYCVTRTCDGNDPNQNCQKDGVCVLSGTPLFWSHSCVSFDVEQDGSPALGISYDQVHKIILDAAVTWSTVDCSGSKPNIVLNDFGPSSCGHPEYNKSNTNANVIMFHDAKPWPYKDSGAGAETLALTTVTFDTVTGEIFDADIEINSADNKFTIDANAGSNATPDLPGVLTHEMGHFLGLSHSNSNVATMFSNWDSGMSVLDQDDVDGICAAMANPARTAGSDCTPRHGFSKDCATANNGCCSTAAGAGSSSAQGLALLGLGVALIGWRARRVRGSRTAARR